MQQTELIPNLFRSEYRKIVSVLCKLFGIDHIEIAEDIVSDTFLLASELWGLKGLPENPAAWLYTVAKNKTKDYLKRNTLFAQNISKEIKYTSTTSEEIEIDLSVKNINDSQLAMMFVVCHPCNAAEAQIGLALNLLCGFGVDEIANAFLTNKTVIYKRLQRAKEKLRTEKIKIEQPTPSEINDRLPAVLTTLYLLFNEGYYSSSQDITLRKDLCLEALRLGLMLTEYAPTNQPQTNALMALMCFHASRFDARQTGEASMVLYEQQDEQLWDRQLIHQGVYFLGLSAAGHELTSYHLEARIAYWHCVKEDTPEKWQEILALYDHLLRVNYSPSVALNRAFALFKVRGAQAALAEAEQLSLDDNHFYFLLMGELYAGIDRQKAKDYWQKACGMAKTQTEKQGIQQKINDLEQVN